MYRFTQKSGYGGKYNTSSLNSSEIRLSATFKRLKFPERQAYFSDHSVITFSADSATLQTLFSYPIFLKLNICHYIFRKRSARLYSNISSTQFCIVLNVNVYHILN